MAGANVSFLWRRLAERWNMALISGADRHGVEPNANINLTNATSFTEFVHEIRCDRSNPCGCWAAVPFPADCEWLGRMRLSCG